MQNTKAVYRHAMSTSHNHTDNSRSVSTHPQNTARALQPGAPADQVILQASARAAANPPVVPAEVQEVREQERQPKPERERQPAGLWTVQK